MSTAEAAPPPLWFSFSPERLAALAAAHSSAYQAARPFPHVVLDDFLPTEVVHRVLAEFPSTGDRRWWSFDNERERKLSGQNQAMFGPTTRHLLEQFNTAVFIDFLRDLTGIDGLVPDPHFHGGGLHQILPGGYLDIHADFNRHPVTWLERRLNLLLYLNRDWREDYGGALELWDRDMSACRQSILPVFNRCVVFSTDSFSHHGHPRPLTCPEGMTRKSLALYYFTKERPAAETDAATRWETHFAGDGPPLLRPRPGRWRNWARRALPPIVTDGIVRLRDRIGESVPGAPR